MARGLKASLAGIVTALLCVAALAWSNAREQALRREELQLETRVVAGQAMMRIRSELEQHRIALQQMATFLEQNDAIGDENFSTFAAATLELAPLCLRIGVVDPTLHIRRVHPSGPNHSLVGFDVRTCPEGHATVLRAAESGQTVLSRPLRLIDGAQGFLLAAPIHREGAIGGEVVCAFHSAAFFSAMRLPEVQDRYDQIVLDGTTQVFASGSTDAQGVSIPWVARQFGLGGRTWQVRIRPRARVVRMHLSSGQAAYWLLGGLLALVVGGVAAGVTHLASGMAHRLRSQGAHLQECSRRLDGTTQKLLQAEKLTALGELVAGVTHELNNPLTSVVGYTQLILNEELPARVRRRLQTVSAEAQRAGRIVQNLLTFARKHPPEKKLLGLNGIIEKTLELKAYHLKVSQIRVEKRLALDLPRTMLDFHQIQQVLLNLLNNAEQAMEETGRGGTLRLATRRTGGRIQALVSDSGPGIPPHVQARIFEPFFTTKKEGKGTGLGLSLCYGIVQEHGGTIRVHSEPGKGATFILELPIVEEPAVAAGGAAPALPGRLPRLSILVVDDEPRVQDLLVDLLGSSGHRVDTASDMPEALRKIAQDRHDLIICDMRMPRGSGEEIYGAIAERAPHLAQRIVFTTGDGANEQTVQFIRKVGNEILIKPYSIKEVERVIAAAIGE